MKKIQLLLIISFLSHSLCSQTSSEINALQELASTFPSLGWAGGNVCAFEGVTCDANSNIIALDIGNNALEGDIPSSIGDLVNLKRLYLENNFFSTLPPSIGNLTQLEELFLFNNEFSNIPVEFQNLVNLTRFWASSNLLTNTPEVLSSMPNLQYINLSFNEIEAIPAFISSFSQLENLLLEQNIIKELPNDLGNLSSLQRLNIKNNQIKKMPDNIDNVSGIQFLLVSSNKLPFHVLESIQDLSLISFDYAPQDSLEEVKNELLAMGAALTLQSGDESPNSSYQWYLNGETVDGATEKEYTIAAATGSDFGVYTCKITNTTFPDLTLWTSDITVEEDATSAIQLASIGSIHSYPNPVVEQLIIELDNQLRGTVSIELYNNLGQSVLHQQFEKWGNNFQESINVNSFDSGSYHVRVHINHFEFSKTIIKN